MTTFKDLSEQQEFDFIRPDSHLNSFFDRCVKVSPRQYQSLRTGMIFTVGSIYADVYHVGHAPQTNGS